MEPMLGEFAGVVSGLSFNSPSIAAVSTVTGGVVGDAWGTPEYWVEQVRRPVLFADAVATMAAQSVTTFLEVGPGGTLTALAQQCLPDNDIAAIATLRRGVPESQSVSTALAQLHVRGVDVDWSALYPGARQVDLPTYPFQRQRFWLDGALRTSGDRAHGTHPFVETVTLADGNGVVCTGRLSVRSHPWLVDHTIADSVLLPGTALLELAGHAAGAAGCDLVDDLTLQTPMVLPAKGAIEVQVVVGADDGSGRHTVRIFSRLANDREEWTEHATGTLGRSESTTPLDLPEWPPVGAEPLIVADLYERLADTGLDYGPTFRGLRAAWRRDDEIFAEVALPESVAVEGFGVHPALLDAALHAIGLGDFVAGDRAHLPFSWSGVQVHSTGATALRVRVASVGESAVSVDLADATGQPVATVESLLIRPLTGARTAVDSLYRLDWTSVDAPQPAGPLADNWLIEYVQRAESADVADAANRTTARVLSALQQLLADEQAADKRMVVVTTGAVAFAGEDVDVVMAPICGLVRAAAAEHPGRFVLVDIDDTPESQQALSAAVELGEPQVAIRAGRLFVPRLAKVTGPELVPPAEPWHLDVTSAGTLENLALLANPAATAPLLPGQVRIAVRAAGLNFRDALGALGMYPGGVIIGAEAAGVVTEVAPDVTDLVAGDRVFGMVAGGIGPLAVTDRRMLATMPAGWTFAEAAAVPVVYLTAYYGLVDLAGLKPGESVLVHAAAGGVGTAAVQLAKHLGADVYATASHGKWPAVRALGVADDHLASSRDLTFAEAFAGNRIDVVLNSLAREFVDASLGLLDHDGRFLEMGKADIRDAAEVAERHHVDYTAFDLVEAGPDRIGEMLTEVLALFDQGVLRLPPITTWDVGSAPDAFRHLGQAKHIGKVVLTVPRPLDPDGTVLITGATGALGGAFARHLVTDHGVRRLLLIGRRGSDAPGVSGLVAELTGLGAEVTVVACDVADRSALAAVLSDIPAEHPLCGVVHSAGVLADGLLESMTVDRLHKVLRPKVDASWLLHELTADADLALFALFSSAAGIVAGGGQANYAAGNAFLDALAQHRTARGLPAVSLAWGQWADGMAGTLTDGDLGRLARSGAIPLSTSDGMRLFDTALAMNDAVLVPMRLDAAGLRALDNVPAVLRGLVRRPAQRAAKPTTLHLADLTSTERDAALLDLVCAQAATVLGHRDTDAVRPTQAFKDLGFDSLTSVELRNRLSSVTGLRLPATVVFDEPNPQALATYLVGQLFPDTATPADDPDAVVRATIASIPLDRLRAAGLLDVLLGLADGPSEEGRTEDSAEIDFEALDMQSLIDLAFDDDSERGDE
jgi:polyketide synthase 12